MLAADRVQMAPQQQEPAEALRPEAAPMEMEAPSSLPWGLDSPPLDPGYVYEKYPQLIVNACYENLFKFYENNGTPAAVPC